MNTQDKRIDTRTEPQHLELRKRLGGTQIRSSNEVGGLGQSYWDPRKECEASRKELEGNMSNFTTKNYGRPPPLTSCSKLTSPTIDQTESDGSCYRTLRTEHFCDFLSKTYNLNLIMEKII